MSDRDSGSQGRRRSAAAGLLAAAVLMFASALSVRVALGIYIDTPPHVAEPVQVAFFCAPVPALLVLLWLSLGWPPVSSFLCFSSKRRYMATSLGVIALGVSIVYWVYMCGSAAFLGLWWQLP